MRALWSERPNCSHNVSQKVKCIRCFSDLQRAFLNISCGLGLFGDPAPRNGGDFLEKCKVMNFRLCQGVFRAFSRERKFSPKFF